MALSLPEVTIEFDPGVIVAQGSGDAYKRVVHVGTASEGDELELVSISSAAEAGAYGQGPLVRSVKHYLYRQREAQLAIRVPTAVDGACGDTRWAESITASEQQIPDDIGVLTFAGTPVDYYDMLVKVVTGGAVGEAYIAVSYDDGYSRATDSILSAASILLDNGVELELDDTNGDFVAGHVYRCRTEQPLMSVSGMQQALDVLAANTDEAKRFGMALVLQGWSKSDLESALDVADTAAAAGEPLLNQFTVFLSFRRPATSEQYVDWIADAASVQYAGGLRVVKAFGLFLTTDPVTGLRANTLALEQMLLIAAAADYRQPLMQLELGALPGVVSSYYQEMPGGQLYPNKWLVPRTHSGYLGYYIAGGLMSCPVGSKLQYFYIRRIADQIQERIVRYAPNALGKLVFTEADAQGVQHLTQESADFWSDRFHDSVAGLIDKSSVSEITVLCTDSTVENETVNLVVAWEAIVASIIGNVTIRGTISIGSN